MGRFDLLNKFVTPVIVINENKETVFINNVFKRVFKDFDNIKKFSHKLDFDAVPLELDSTSVYSPIFQAYNSKEDFSAHIKYQTASNEYLYFDINSTKRGKYTIIIFIIFNIKAYC